MVPASRVNIGIYEETGTDRFSNIFDCIGSALPKVRWWGIGDRSSICNTRHQDREIGSTQFDGSSQTILLVYKNILECK
mgnify:CR=1 FL=1